MSGYQESKSQSSALPASAGIGKNQRKKLTQERARELFDYREDGFLIWRVTLNSRAVKGTVAGCLDRSNGYVYVGIGGDCFRAHRVIWLWHKGYMPEHGLDHINKRRADNRIENLRETSQSCNMRNRSQQSSFSGVKGVGPSRLGWCATIRIGPKLRYIGRSNCLVEAVCLRLAAEQAEGWESCEKTSPAFLFVQKYLKENQRV